MEALAQMLISLVSGAVGGNIIVAVLLKKFDLGFQGNTIAGFIGGFLGEQLLGAPGSLQNTGMMSDIVNSAAGGSTLIAIVAFFKNSIAKRTRAGSSQRSSLGREAKKMPRMGLESCPYCQSSDICFSRPQDSWEKMAILFLVRPVRCGRCVRRHYRPLFLHTLQDPTRIPGPTKSVQPVSSAEQDEHRAA